MHDLLERLQHAVGDAYRVDRELGGGGMSRLFLAFERSLERQVVLKVLPPDLADDVSAERFKREVQLIAQLQHPHIVPVLGAANKDGITWYVMPFVKGESLRARLDRDGALPVAEATTIIGDAADALAYAHRQGVVHRDIKPENILLEEGHAIVADFGIAHAANAAAGRLTATGVSVGTIGYMSPEQASGESNIDGRSDVYSLAMVGYEALTGRPPFPGLTGAQLVAAQVRDVPPAPSTVRKEIPASVSNAIMRALAKSPDERYQTADEFGAAIAPAVVASSSRLWRRAAIAAAAVVMVGVGAVIVRGFTARPSVLDDNSIAIAPFTVLAPELSLWKEGLVDVLARGLDGMGPLRTVPPSISIKGWSGSADQRSAVALASRAGARIVIFGTLQQTGRDTARVLATIYDAAVGTKVADIDWRDEVSRIDRLADTLTVRAVRELARDRRLSLTPRATLVGSRSIPAIKEFLLAERLQRGGLFDSASAHYQRAIDLDSTFTLAYWGLGNAYGWKPRRTSDDLLPFIRAGNLNHGLGPRDSLLVLMDSVRAGAQVGAQAVNDTASPLIGRALALLKTITTRYPDDAVGWFRWGELRLHEGLTSGEMSSLAELALPFDKAIAADAGYSEVYIHAIQIAMATGDRTKTLRLLTEAEERSRDSQLAPRVRWLRWLLTQRDRGNADLKTFVDSVSDSTWFAALFFLNGLHFPDSSATVAHLLSLAAQAGRQVTGVPPRERLAAHATESFGYHGQLGNAQGTGIPLSPTSAAALARLGIVNADSVAAQVSALGADTAQGGRTALRLLPFWAWRRDTVAILTARQQFLAGPVPSNYRGQRRRQFNVGVVEGFLALARGDSAEAVRRFSDLPYLAPDPLVATWAWHAAPLFAERGRMADAMRMALVPGPLASFSSNTAENAERLLYAARIAERAGERAAAADFYAQLLRAWIHADSGFNDYVAEARAGMERLARDRGPGTEVKK